MKRGWGERLEASFRPGIRWGAEFLADRVRICGLREEGGKVVVAATFEGGYAEAETFARARGLAFAGLNAAVSHIPFKLEVLEASAAGAEEDAALQAERFKPAGLPLDSLEIQGFSRDGERYLVMAREEAVRGFSERLPDSLSGLWGLAPSPLVLLSRADLKETPGRMAALIVEEGYTHALFLRGGGIEAYAKAFTGLQEARSNPSAYAREMKALLIYHHGSKFLGTSLDAISLWSDGSEGEAASALAALGIAQVHPAWKPGFEPVAAPFQAAGSAAWLGLEDAEAAVSWTTSRPRLAESRRLWMERAGQLARTGYKLAVAGVVAVLLLAASALVFRWVVEAKATTWSGELRKWDRFQLRRVAVERHLEELQGLLARRTEGYASLQRIASSLPPEVWLQEWEAEAGDRGRFVHRLTGYSLAESRVPQFLARLEDGKRFRSVKLKSTERIKGEKVEKETGIAANRKDLVRFQVVVAE